MNEFRSGCSIATTLDILGDKWSLLIVRDLFLGRNTFSEFLKSAPEGIASNILNDRLKKMRLFEILDYRKNPADKKIKEYYLTDKGVDLFPVLYSMHRWSVAHILFEKHPLTLELIEKTEGKSNEEVISETKAAYLDQRFREFAL
jgi:DNA-binding HxlR family transcriptional regulator